MKLIRNRADLYGIFGKMIDDQSNQLAVTLEHAFLQADGSYKPKLADGSYICIKRKSPKFGYNLFLIQNVPDFMGQTVTYIEIHIGNYNKDSDGCVLLGSAIGVGCILDSRLAFENFMANMEDEQTFTLDVSTIAA